MPPFYEADLADGHLVGGQGAGFVRADDGGATKGLHRGQRAHNGVLLGHTTGSQSQASGDDSGQSLWDSSHSQGNGDLEVVDGSLDPRSTVSWVVEMTDVDSPYCDTYN